MSNSTRHIQEIPLNEEEKYCENHFAENVSRNENSQYVIRIPFKNGLSEPTLGNSRKIALASLFQLEKRFKAKPQLAVEYKKFIDEYINLGHMEAVDYDPNALIYYLPHHCVLRDSTTTKLRVVFNASQKTDNGKSLNDFLAIGALPQTDMINIILKFRLFKIAFTADVEKMYRQIQIHDDQTNFQRILWRDNPNAPIQDFKLKTITYGTANAPYLAIRTLKQLAADVTNTNPIASQLIANSMYVDDLVAGASSNESAIQTYHEIKNAFNSAGMNLRKWCTTSHELRSIIPEQDLEMKACNSNVKALGISWCAQTDEFTFDFKFNNNNNNSLTKRSLLSEIAKLYDPLGWISPVIIKAKKLNAVDVERANKLGRSSNKVYYQ